MIMAKLNFKDISIAYAGATVASVSTGLVGSYVWSKFGYDVDVGLVVSSAWLLTVGVPSTLVAAETLRRKLGEGQPIIIRAAGGSRGRGRAIPVTSNGRKTHVFLSIMPLLGFQPKIAQTNQAESPDTFTVSVDENTYSVTSDEIESFLRVGWQRQRSGNFAFSRVYWTRQHRPRLKPLEYYTRLNVLLSYEGMILDRGKRRSGRLAYPPLAAIKALQGQFSLV